MSASITRVLARAAFSPIITGRVYNAEQVPPYSLPGNKTQSGVKSRSSKGGSTANFNEIRFEDKADSEQLMIQAQKQMDTNVKADHFHSVGGNYHLNVGGKDEGSLYELVKKDKHVHVKNNSNTLIDADEKRRNDLAQLVWRQFVDAASNGIER